MSIHLMCLSSSGTPIFTKKRGDNVENVCSQLNREYRMKCFINFLILAAIFHSRVAQWSSSLLQNPKCWSGNDPL